MTPVPHNSADLSQLNYAYGQPEATGLYKVLPQDFIVEEQIAFQLSGEGEHLWCWVEKTGENTDWVLQQLAKWAGVSPSRIGVAGQKDRHAVTRQWFSIQLPGLVNPEPDALGLDNVKILKTVRHQRKLQTGGLSGNRFTLKLRCIKSQPGVESDPLISHLEERLTQIKTHGVPNYFGEQRFGIYGRNLKQGERLLAGELPRVKRNQKSLYLSAIRSWMFNVLLSERVGRQDWNQLLPGDVLQLEGSNRWFLEDATQALQSRVRELDLHPTGPLYGQGDLPSKQSAFEIETTVAKRFAIWIDGLVQYGVKQDRRALRTVPLGFEWRWLDESAVHTDALAQAFKKLDVEVEEAMALPVLQVSFELRAGSYATMVLRELLEAQDYQTVLKANAHVTE